MTGGHLLDLLRALDSMPFQDPAGKRVAFILTQIGERYERLRTGAAIPGDRIGILRRGYRLARMCKGPADIVWLATQLARFDDEALFEWQANFVRRRKTRAMQKVEDRLRRTSRAAKLEARDNAIFLRVLDHRQKTGCSLTIAIESVARGDDGPLGLLRVKPKCLSTALVKRAYETRLRLARIEQRLARPKGMFAGGYRYTALPPLRGRGRPRLK